MTEEIKTRLQLRDELAGLFTVKYAHLPTKELLSEAAATYVVCSIMTGLERDVVLSIVGEAYDKLNEHREQILSMNLPPTEIAEA